MAPREAWLKVHPVPATCRPLREPRDAVDDWAREPFAVTAQRVRELERERRPRACERMELDDLEASPLEQVPQPKRGVAEEVPWGLVDRPDERRRQDQMPAGPQ